MALNPGDRLAHYEVIAPLGAGGMGEVYRARDTRLGRDVAIKILPDANASSPERVKRFEQESRAASALSDPHIVTVHDAGAHDGTFYIVSELVDGSDLRALTAERMPIRRALDIAGQIASGLATAHEKGIVHRDLKPENVLVTKSGLAKIADFGLAKLDNESAENDSRLPTMPMVRTAAGTIVGTVAYMSPEQAGGQPVDFRSDQFSLGLILYEMLAGRRAFRRGSTPETLAAIIRDEPEPLPQTSPPIPPLVRWILERCLKKDPRERYGSTADLRRDLETARDHLSELSAAQVTTMPPKRIGTRGVVAAAIVLAILAGALLDRSLHKPTAIPPPVYQQSSFRPGTIGNARFEPDGQTILYDIRLDGGPWHIYSTRVDSVESTALDLPDAHLFSISSTGRVAIGLARDGSLPTLAEVPLAGGAPRKILDGVTAADWAPDGKHLAVSHFVGDQTRLEYPIGRTLFDPGPVSYVNGVRFSPDGRYLAFRVSRWTEYQGTIAVYVYDLEKKTTRLLTRGWNAGLSLAWTPHSDEIWFSARPSSSSSGVQAINAVDLSGRTRVVDQLPWVLAILDVSRDGRALVSHNYWPATIIFRGPHDTSERDLSWLEGSYPHDLSADGRTLLFDEPGPSGGALGAVYIRTTDESSTPVRLGQGLPQRLSEDGKWVIALTAGQPGTMKLLPTGAGQTVDLTTHGMRYLGAEWFPDSRQVLFQGIAGARGKPRLYEQDINGGAPRALSLAATELGPVSPDGSTIAAHGPDGRIDLIPLDGRAPRPLPGTSEREDVIRWSTDGQALFLQSGTVPLSVTRFDIASGREEPLYEFKPTDRVGVTWMRVLLTGDGQGYCYSYTRYIDTLYLVTGLH